jgi:hypothetical protein
MMVLMESTLHSDCEVGMQVKYINRWCYSEWLQGKLKNYLTLKFSKNPNWVRSKLLGYSNKLGTFSFSTKTSTVQSVCTWIDCINFSILGIFIKQRTYKELCKTIRKKLRAQNKFWQDLTINLHYMLVNKSKQQSQISLAFVIESTKSLIHVNSISLNV